MSSEYLLIVWYANSATKITCEVHHYYTPHSSIVRNPGVIFIVVKVLSTFFTGYICLVCLRINVPLYMFDISIYANIQRIWPVLLDQYSQ